ncbi:MAG: ABC transporter ATP-binding protein [Saprospiraceae bacterium]|nr:ABC transporter ATP-binding protein [Saprospiraceae bacterium]
MATILQTKNLTKSYGKTLALNNLTITIEQGQVVGILGPNGSGKTTTLGIILNILKKDSGSFEWFEGAYGHHFNRKIGAILETPNFYPYLNAVDNLNIIKHIKNSEKDDIYELLKLVDLADRSTSRFNTYSLGMKQRLAIAGTLIGNPEVLIFDEPTNGLDPQGIAEVRNILKRIAQSGKTVIMASHMLDEVEKICDQVAIIKKGKLLAFGKIGQIIHDDKLIEIDSDNRQKLQEWLTHQTWVKSWLLSKDHIELTTSKDLPHSFVNQNAFENGIILHHLVMKKKSLEEEFLHITKN